MLTVWYNENPSDVDELIFGNDEEAYNKHSRK